MTHADVQALAASGLIDTSGDGLRVNYNAIETRIAISA